MKPVHYAGMFGQWEIVKLLEEHGANLDSDSRQGLLPSMTNSSVS